MAEAKKERSSLTIWAAAGDSHEALVVYKFIELQRKFEDVGLKLFVKPDRKMAYDGQLEGTVFGVVQWVANRYVIETFMTLDEVDKWFSNRSVNIDCFPAGV